MTGWGCQGQQVAALEEQVVKQIAAPLPRLLALRCPALPSRPAPAPPPHLRHLIGHLLPHLRLHQHTPLLRLLQVGNQLLHLRLQGWHRQRVE